MVDEIYQVSFNKMHLGVTQNHSFFFFPFNILAGQIVPLLRVWI